MQHTTWVARAVAAGLVTGAARPLWGAELPQGRWSGALVPPDGPEVAVELSVSDMAGRPLATLSLAGGRMVGLSNIVVADGALAFGYYLDGSSVQCRLSRNEDGSYAGPCVDGAGAEGSLQVSPVR